MNFQPLYDRVLVKRVAVATKSAGGIILPDSPKDKPQEAIVVAVGPGRRLDNGDIYPLTISVGQHVLFGKYTGDIIKLGEEEHIVLRAEDILGIVH